MKGSMTAAAVHKQYEDGISAFRRQIGDAALRQRFAAEADAFFRACALGVWGRDGNGDPFQRAGADGAHPAEAASAAGRH